MSSTLPSLRNQPAEEVEAVLANLTLAMLPNPGIQPEGEGFLLEPSLKDRLLQEIRIRLGLRRDDNSPKAISRIHQYLSEEMRRATLSKTNISEVRARIGQRGDLSPQLYQVVLADTMKLTLKFWGISQTDVEDTALFPHAVEHLTPKGHELEDNKALSLYIKTYKLRKKEDVYTLVVLSNREGYKQILLDAWRVYHSDVDLTKTKTPLDVLRAFVSEYGFTIRVGDKTSKMFLYEEVQVEKGKKTSDLMQVETPNKEAGQASWLSEGIPGGVRLVIALSINQEKYRADLIRHGVRLPEWPKEVVSSSQYLNP